MAKKGIGRPSKKQIEDEKALNKQDTKALLEELMDEKSPTPAIDAPTTEAPTPETPKSSSQQRRTKREAQAPNTEAVSSAIEAAHFWAQKTVDRRELDSDTRITQPAYFNMEFDSSIVLLEEIELSEEELEEGMKQWENTLIGSMIGTEVKTRMWNAM